MSLTGIVAGVVERLETIRDAQSLTILDYEPKATQVSPIAMVLFTNFHGRNTKGQVSTTPWNVTVWLMVKWQDNQGATRQMNALIDAVIQAIESDPQLGARITSGLASVTDGEGGRIRTFGGTEYLTTGITVTAVDKVEYAGAIR